MSRDFKHSDVAWNFKIWNFKVYANGADLHSDKNSADEISADRISKPLKFRNSKGFENFKIPPF